ncbi:MAG: hypothetical protein ABI619_13860 [Betaproteobacteria bacterium]
MEPFSYLTFHEHDGVIWLRVTQVDSSPSHKERNMFGRLERDGEFQTQSRKTEYQA